MFRNYFFMVLLLIGFKFFEISFAQESKDCLENEIFCPEYEKCIDIKLPCKDKCLSNETPNRFKSFSLCEKTYGNGTWEDGCCSYCKWHEYPCGSDCLPK